MTTEFLERIVKSRNEYLVQFVRENDIRDAQKLHDALIRQKTKLGRKLGTTSDTSISKELFKIQEVFDNFDKIFA